MEERLSARLEREAGLPGLIEGLVDRLSGSDLNSLLLEVYRQKAAKIDATELLARYRNNRLVQPSPIDMIGLLELELQVLRYMRGHGFHAVELSPAAQFGSCSVVATVDQQKVLSAVRNTEIMADATNALALHIASTVRAMGGRSAEAGRRHEDRVAQRSGGRNRLCTVHRHIRTQPFPTGYFPHFKIGCMVSSGLDVGNYGFECGALLEQLRVLFGLLRKLGTRKPDGRASQGRASGPAERGADGPPEGGLGSLRLVLRRRGGYDERNPLIDRIHAHLVQALPDETIELEDAPADNDYYKGIQFKLYVNTDERVWEIADGGFVDWTQQLLGNRKERLLISGFGLEWLYKIKNPALVAQG